MSSRWVSKPPVGSQIEWGHPLSKGLVGAWLMNEGGGNRVNNLSNPRTSGTMSGGSWKSLDKSRGVLLDGTNGTILLNNPPLDPAGKPCTIIADVVENNIAASQYLLNANDSGGTRAFSIIAAHALTANCLQIQQITSGNPYVERWADVFTTGKSLHLSITWNGAYIRDSAKLFRNGVFQPTTIAVSTTGTPTQATGSWNISGRTADTTFRWNGAINYIYFFNRMLSPSEIKSLYESPYQFIKGPSTITYFTAPVGGWVWGGEVKNVMVA